MKLIYVIDNYFFQSLQRLADSWHCSIGSSALSILIAYFESQDNLQDSDEGCADFTEYALDKLRFCYKKAEGDDEEVSASHVWCSMRLTQYRSLSFVDFIKAVLSFKLSANTSLLLMVLKRFLTFSMETPSLVGLSCCQLQRYVILISLFFY